MKMSWLVEVGREEKQCTSLAIERIEIDLIMVIIDF